MGPDASKRIYGDLNDGDEVFEVKPGKNAGEVIVTLPSKAASTEKVAPQPE